MMNRLLVILLLVGCGPHQGANVTHAVDCFDGCNSTYQEKLREFRGTDGTNGAAGADGNAGTNGAQGIPGPRGPAGMDGADGKDGRDGEAGTSCTLQEVEEGVIVTCGHDSVLIEKPELILAEVIDPCGSETDYDEVILHYTDGESSIFIALFTTGSSALNSRLSVLHEGVTYKTTDGTNCKFIIELGEVIEVD